MQFGLDVTVFHLSSVVKLNSNSNVCVFIILVLFCTVYLTDYMGKRTSPIMYLCNKEM